MFLNVLKPYTNAAESISEKLDYNIVCHVRISTEEQIHDEIDTDLCTHIVYYSVKLHGKKLTINPATFFHFDRRYGRQVAAYKSKGIKVTVQLSEWNSPIQTNAKYLRLVQNEKARTKFVNDAVAFLDKHNLDGLELQWQYPMCWDDECDSDKSPAKLYLDQFVEEISAVFKAKGLLLSLFMAAPQSIEEQHDIVGLSKNLDWIVVTTLNSKHEHRNQTGMSIEMFGIHCGRAHKNFMYFVTHLALHHPLNQHPHDNQPNHNMVTRRYSVQRNSKYTKRTPRLSSLFRHLHSTIGYKMVSIHVN